MNKAKELDTKDQLASFKDEFIIVDEELIYLDGNSLGRLPKKTIDRINQVMKKEWGENLITSWDKWISLSSRMGDQIATSVVGAQPEEVIVSDNVTTNIYKILRHCINIDKRIILTNKENFPTNKYIMQGLKQQNEKIDIIFFESDPLLGPSARQINEELQKIDATKAVVMLTHVDFRSGALAQMEEINKVVHKHGALVFWDLCHSAGVVPMKLHEWKTDFAVGCTYKYLNAGPGSPAFIFIHKNRLVKFTSPITGWFSQKNQFSFGHDYIPKESIEKAQSGTPSIIATSALEESLDIIKRASIEAIRKKSIDLCRFLIDLVEKELKGYEFKVITPIDSTKRGSHVSLTHPKAFSIALALRDKKVVPDFRPPNCIRLGLVPLYTSFSDIEKFVDRLKEIMKKQLYKQFEESEVVVP